MDDDKDLRDSLKFLLATRQIAVTSFAGGREFFDALPGLSPAPIILDLRMPRMDGLQFLAEFSKSNLSWPVIVLSGHGEIRAAVKAIKLGAVDFLEKPITLPELERCIESAFATLETKREFADVQRGAAQQFSSLTRREQEVLERLCRGRSNKQVAFDLEISPRTVEMHRANALRHLGVRSIAEVVNLQNLARSKTPT